MFSTNPHIKFWIDQFNFEDRQVARDLLSELVYIDTARFMTEVESLLVDLILKSGKVAIIPVRELLDKEECYFPQSFDEIEIYLNQQGLKIESKSLDQIKNKQTGKTVTKKEIEGFSPVLLNPVAIPGSESIVANLITQLKRKYKNKVVTGTREMNPSVKELRKEKCRSLILVDDVIGSGQRMYDFILSITKNKTINSWISGGIIKLVAVSYMRSRDSEKILKNIKQKFENITVNEFPTFFDVDADKLEKYERLIVKYSNKNEKLPFGYDNTFGRAIFEHSVPNNIPAILWRDVNKWQPVGQGIVHQGRWASLFPGRSMPDVIKQSVRSKFTKDSKNREKLRVVLQIFRNENGINTARQLARHLGWDTSISKDIIARLQMNGLLDSGLKVTDLGLAELEYLEHVRKLVECNEDNYYPMSLMGRASAHTA